jgi:hypothetical protein
MLHNLYSSPNIIRMNTLTMRWAGHAECMDEMQNECRISVRKTESEETTWESKVQIVG